MPQYLCPLCQTALTLSDKIFRCDNNHCFDLAKEGYVNLLPVQHKKSKQPGDNKAMVRARREFLEQGFYQPLIDKLTALQRHYLPANEAYNLLDAGCGEGYYTHQHKTEHNCVYGVDIAKEAVKIAAKKYRNCHFSVGTLSQLPFANDFFAWMVSIYAPILDTEFNRVLSSGGYLITVTPAENHLHELKAVIYQQAQQHDMEKSPISSLELIAQERLNYQMDFANSQQVLDLLAMTPFAFKASNEALAKLKALASFSCQADFDIRVYKKP